MHRLRLLIRSAQPLPLTLRHPLVGRLHAWWGTGNAYHDAPSAYAFGRVRPLDRPSAAATHVWTLGMSDPEAALALAAGIAAHPELFPGAPVVGIEATDAPEVWPARTFWHTDSPLLLRVGVGQGRKIHLTWDHPDAAARLADGLRRRLGPLARRAPSAQGADERPGEAVRVGFTAPGTSFAEDVHGRTCPVSHVGIWVEGPPEAHRSVWACGLGQNTGIGFGMLALLGDDADAPAAA